MCVLHLYYKQITYIFYLLYFKINVGICILNCILINKSSNGSCMSMHISNLRFDTSYLIFLFLLNLSEKSESATRSHV